MKTKFLLPQKFNKIGWIMFSIGLIGGLLYLLFNGSEWLPFQTFNMAEWKWTPNGIFDEIISILLITGGLMAGFSKEKIEDEYIMKIRMESLTWAIYCHYLILLAATLLVFDLSFLTIMIFNMFTILIIFNFRFQWLLWKIKKEQ